MTKLFVGPIIGEFGHELMVAAVIRAKSREFDHTTVCSRPHCEGLYHDFASVFIGHKIECEGTDLGGYRVGATPGTITREMRAYLPRDTKTVVWNPAPYPPGLHAKEQPAEWVAYGEPMEPFLNAVVFHARARKHDAKRNWPEAQWGKLVAALRKAGHDERFICIGTKRDALHVPGCDDLRGADLLTQMDVLRSARVAIGPSSGPMHLAQHCLCPVVVWCGGDEAPETVTKYERLWNPHGVPCKAVEYPSWQPSVEEVVGWVEGFRGRTH